MEKLLWKDGHITTIASSEAFARSYSDYSEETGNVWCMKYADSIFEWHNNMWMEI